MPTSADSLKPRSGLIIRRAQARVLPGPLTAKGLLIATPSERPCRALRELNDLDGSMQSQDDAVRRAVSFVHVLSLFRCEASRGERGDGKANPQSRGGALRRELCPEIVPTA
jgi:hypothetical protein